jgi:hypothetical protein
MTTRTELIARLRHYQKEFDYDPFYKDGADMLEADAEAEYSGQKTRANIANCQTDTTVGRVSGAK